MEPTTPSNSDFPAPDAAERVTPTQTGSAAGSGGGNGGGDDKLIPEWKLSGDNQIIALGLLVLFLIVGVGAWNIATGDDEAAGDDVAVEETNSGSNNDDEDTALDDLRDGDIDGSGNDVATAGDLDDSSEGADAGAEPDGTEIAAALEPDVDASVAAFSGVAASVFDNNGVPTAVLRGAVGTSNDSDTAATNALGVDGIEAVDNQLTIVQPQVETALTDAGVTAPAVTMDDINATVAGTIPDEDTRTAAITAAEAVPGIGTVTDELTIDAPEPDGTDSDADADADSDADSEPADLQAAVDSALATVGDPAAGVTGTVDGDAVTLTGTAPDEAARDAAVAAATAVDGVGSVDDQITIASTDDVDRIDSINSVLEANPVQFRSSSAEIVEESFATLDEVVAALEGTSLPIRIEGYTDTLGSSESNLTLSQDRAAAVLQYLTDNGVDTAQMEAVGLGETDQFGAGNTVEALAANRRVLFRLI